MRIIVAPDKFKGVLDARSAAQAIAEGVLRARPHAEVPVVPMADGGEGTLGALLTALTGNRRIVRATGPLGDPVEATIGLINQATTAVIELASISGYTLVPPDRRDPLQTSTYGLGEVIRTVIECGIEEIIIALGGSATVDGGIGMMQALGMTFLDRAGRLMPGGQEGAGTSQDGSVASLRGHRLGASPLLPRGLAGGDLLDVSRISWDHPPENIEHVQFTVACDVLNPACGPNGAAAVFGPQKGADPEGVQLLERGLSHWVDLLEGAGGRVIRNEPGTGAAGGVALPLLALTHAAVIPGVDLVSESYGLTDLIAGADLVITGEGRLDRQSMMGKVVGAVARMSRAAGVRCVALVGATGPGAKDCLSLLDRYETLDAPFDQTAGRLSELAERLARDLP
jgi:glycerate kinase